MHVLLVLLSLHSSGCSAYMHAGIPPSFMSFLKETSLSHHPCPIACHTQFLPDPVIVCRRKLKYPSLPLQASSQRDKYLVLHHVLLIPVSLDAPRFALLLYQCFRLCSIRDRPVRFDVYPYTLASSAGCPTPWTPSRSSSTHEALQSY